MITLVPKLFWYGSCLCLFVVLNELKPSMVGNHWSRLTPTTQQVEQLGQLVRASGAYQVSVRTVSFLVGGNLGHLA